MALQTERASVAAQGRKIETEAAPIRYVDRAWVEATFAQHVPNEEDVEEVARAQWMLDSHRQLRAMIEEQAARAQAKLAEFVRAEREMEEALARQKAAYLGKLARGEVGKTDEATKKPKRKRKSRRS